MGQGLELYGRRKDGIEFPVEISLSPLETEEGTLVSAAVRDITERKRVEEAARRSEKELRHVIETMPAMTWTALPDGSADLVNRQWLEYTGLSTKDALGSRWQGAQFTLKICSELSPSGTRPWLPASRSRMNYANGAATGEYRWFLVRGVPLRDEQGNILKWYGVLTDIDNRKRAEQERERLRQVEADLARMSRVSMMGAWAASLSHELKQPITAGIISASTTLNCLRQNLPNLEKACETATKAVKAGNRAAEIIDRLRSLYTKATPRYELLDGNEIIREMLEMLRGQANRYRVSMDTDLTADVAMIMSDRVQLQQVLINLILNAIEAMEETGGSLFRRVAAE